VAQPGAQILRVGVDARRKTRASGRPLTLIARAADADDPGALDGCHLPGHRARHVRHRGNQYCLTGTQPREIEQSEVGRHARRAKQPERRRGGRLTRVQCRSMVPVGGEDIVPGFQHFADTQRGHDVTGPWTRA
jgi:hypothetical protein